MTSHKKACFSLFPEDWELLKQHVDALKNRDGAAAGWNQSALIRLMIRNLDTKSVPRRRKP